MLDWVTGVSENVAGINKTRGRWSDIVEVRLLHIAYIKNIVRKYIVSYCLWIASCAGWMENILQKHIRRNWVEKFICSSMFIIF